MFLRKAWLAAGLALAVAGLAAGSGPVLALGVFVTLLGFFARVWADRSLQHVELERSLLEWRGFPGDRLTLRYRLTNRKAIPLPWLEVSDRLPEAVSPPELHLPLAGAKGARLFTHTTRLGWYGRTSWSLQVACLERGYYRLGPALLRSGDAFGLFTSERQEETTAELIVYPRTVPLAELGIAAARPLGERKGFQRIFEDPLRVSGVRDYQRGDPLRRIHWKAAARLGRLQSRVYEPSATQHLIVALNIDTLEHAWQGYVPWLLEASIVVAASVARWAYEARYAVGLLTNGSLPDSDQPVKIPPGRAPEQLPRILGALSAAGPMTLVSLAALLERECRSLPLGSTLAVVTALMPEALAAQLHRLHGSGNQVAVLAMADDDWSELLGEIPSQRINLPLEASSAPSVSFVRP